MVSDFWCYVCYAHAINSFVSGGLKKGYLQKRTQSVKDFLVKMGVSPDQMTTVGYGESKPIMTNDTPEGKSKNRRVEIRFVNWIFLKIVRITAMYGIN